MKLLTTVKKQFKNNYFHYLLLTTLAVLFLSLITLLNNNKEAKLVVFMTFTFIYIAWGIIHHAVEKTLTFKVVVEYVLFGSIALFLFGSLLVN